MEFLLIEDSFIFQAKIILQLFPKLNANTQNQKTKYRRLQEWLMSKYITATFICC